MTNTWSGQQPRELNEETIAEVRGRIGIPVRYSPRNHNEVSSTDSFRHFALAFGDDNPLYTDPLYAQASSWARSERSGRDRAHASIRGHRLSERARAGSPGQSDARRGR